MRPLQVSVAVAFVILLAVATTLAEPASAWHVEVTPGAEIALLLCYHYKQVMFRWGSTWWGDAFEVGPTFAHFDNFSQTPYGPTLSFGLGCDPNLPTDNATIWEVTPRGVLLTFDATKGNGSIYGIFYYGTLGIPKETTFSEQNPVENTNYFTSYPDFLSTLTSPVVYLNSTGGYVEWRVSATVYPQSIYFTNTPTHATIPPNVTQFPIDCSQLSNWPMCAVNWLQSSPAVLLILIVFGGIWGFVELIGKGVWHLMKHRTKRDSAKRGM